MNLEPYNGTKGKTVREKIHSIVETRTRKQNPPVVDLPAVMITLDYSHVMDPESDPQIVLNHLCLDGDLVRVDNPPDRSRPILALPTPDVFRYLLGNDPEHIRERTVQEAEGHAREKYIGAMNQLFKEVSDEGD